MATATVRNLSEAPHSSLDSKQAPTGEQNDDRLLDARQVAARLGVSERFIRDHTTRRFPRIAGVRLGKLMRYRIADIDTFVAELNTLSTSKRS